MEKMLLKLARQLDAMDEASLTALWSKYATIASRFEPTRRWEEACLVFSMIQAKRWKNQLFNYAWQKQRMPPVKRDSGDAGPLPEFQFDLPDMAPESEPELRKPCKVLQFSKVTDLGGEDK